MAYGDFRNLPRTTSAKIWSDKGFDIAKNLQYDGYWQELATLVDIFFDKKFATHKWTGINYDTVSNNQQLAKLQNAINRKVF